MRLTVITACLLLLLLAPACAAPAPTPPWSAPDRELISSTPWQNFYFIASSVRMYPESEGCVVETVRELASTTDGSAKYILETIQITPFIGWMRIMSTKAYDTKGKLLYTRPAGNWQLGDADPWDHDNLRSVIADYIEKNRARLIDKSHPTVADTWYVKVHATSAGDTYYFHPGTIVPLDNYIQFKMRVDYGREKDGAKSMTQTLLVDVTKLLYFTVPVADVSTIRSGTDMGDFLLKVIEHCRRHFLAVPVPFDQSIPRLVPFRDPEGSPAHFFDPASIQVRDGCLQVVMVSRISSGYLASLQYFRFSDQKTTCVGMRQYDLAGKENGPHTYYSGIQEWDWGAIEPDSLHDRLFNAVFSYCREHDISLDP